MSHAAPLVPPTDRGGLTLVDVTSVESHGGALRLMLEPGRQPVVASRRVAVTDALHVDLSVLAASHRIIVGTDPGGILLSETVACGTTVQPAVSPTALPAEHRWTTPAGAHGWFRSQVHRGAGAVSAARSRIEHHAESTTPGLHVQFPGHVDALTSLLVTGTGSDLVAWSTWHLYPGDDPHVVETTTTVHLPDTPQLPRS